jgi:hypothetical protein
VDVGGGLGSQSLTLAQHNPHLRFIVQDRDPVVKEAIPVRMLSSIGKIAEADCQLVLEYAFPRCSGVGKSNSPRYVVYLYVIALTQLRASLIVHNFFEPQVIKNADVFLLHMIIHDWSDKDCIRILRHLRDAATPSTQLLVVDNLMAYACVDESTKDIPGAEMPLPPIPLLPNYGHARAAQYYEDAIMLELQNAKERTIAELVRLLEGTGWKLARVVQSIDISTQKAIAIPA